MGRVSGKRACGQTDPATERADLVPLSGEKYAIRWPKMAGLVMPCIAGRKNNPYFVKKTS
jgi:hypothetical protein